eukprot:TRINITY_DN10209_c0_g1_i3.p1 TRINITY_DN10209_c0_g1~~TRINITY_DN10209_c0_g1_i3.p1  ORF type:complete len:785 (+),score=98.12 TRINITY_DN10209_c0_g1_i3:65-2419(+)
MEKAYSGSTRSDLRSDSVREVQKEEVRQCYRIALGSLGWILLKLYIATVALALFQILLIRDSTLIIEGWIAQLFCALGFVLFLKQKQSTLVDVLLTFVWVLVVGLLCPAGAISNQKTTYSRSFGFFQGSFAASLTFYVAFLIQNMWMKRLLLALFGAIVLHADTSMTSQTTALMAVLLFFGLCIRKESPFIENKLKQETFELYEELVDPFIVFDVSGRLLLQSRGFEKLFPGDSKPIENCQEFVRKYSPFFRTITERKEYQISRSRISNETLEQTGRSRAELDKLGDLISYLQFLLRRSLRRASTAETWERVDDRPRGDYAILDAVIERPNGTSCAELRWKKGRFADRPVAILSFRDGTDSSQAARRREVDEYKNRLLSTLAHQIKTPLNGMLPLLSEAMQADVIVPEVKQKVVEPVFVHARQLLFLMHDFLDLAHFGLRNFVLNVAPFDFRRQIEEVTSLFRGQAALKNIAFRTEIDADVPTTVVGEARRFSQVLMNLLSNAFKFTTSGEVRVTVHRIGSDLHITVRDTGIGVRPEIAEVLTKILSESDFRNVEQLDTMGIGLGLKASSVLVRLISGGKLSFRSTQGGGAKFSFNLPISGVVNTEEREEEPSSDDFDPSIEENPRFDALRTATGRKIRSPCVGQRSLSQTCFCKRVVVVDDNDYNRFVLERLLLERKYAVFQAANGVQALELIADLNLREQRCSSPECRRITMVFMDLDMPIMNGFEATRILKHKFPSIPVVVCSALDDQKSLNEAVLNGAIDHIPKPVFPERMEKVLKKWTF